MDLSTVASPELDARRRALFEALRGEPARTLRIPRRRATNEPVPMSFAQQRLWFLHQLNPGSAAYNCPIPLRLRGQLDDEALRAALADIIERHELLRTRYTMVDGAAMQWVSEEAAPVVPLLDLRTRPEDIRQQALHDRIDADANRPFDLAGNSVIRAELLRLADDEHILLFDIHHIANDHGSIRAFLHELAEGYSARIERRPPALPELTIQYADYALWQRERVAGPRGDTDWAFWRRALDGIEPIVLPADRVRPPTPSSRGELRILWLPPALVEQLRAIGRAEGATLFVVLLTAFKLLLARYLGQGDIAIGCSATNRDRPELQDLIGFFVNTIVLRTRLDETRSFRDAVRDVRAVVTQAWGIANSRSISWSSD